jgi:nucleotide-binding universal stress UspA family protein
MAIERRLDGGQALLGLAAQEGSDLLVMGCYGHSQFRELFLGGVTRYVLQNARLPVLMAH